MKRCLPLFILIFTPVLLWGQIADYLIIENPSEFLIHNKYQQKLRAEENQALAQYTPFRIITDNEILSDQITYATRCSFDNSVYFIIKDETKRYLTQNDEAYFEVFPNSEIIQDTIMTLRDDQILLRNRPKRTRFSSVLYELKQGEKWIRVFKYRDVYFLKNVDAPLKFGWADLPDDGSWQVYVHTTGQIQPIPDRITARIETRIVSANHTYQQFFTFFNKKYRENRMIPVWTLQSSETSIRGVLSGPESIGKLPLSSAALLNELENIILGTGLSINRTSDGFIIQVKNRP